jgi:nucleotide-binding universal stress UspA family protein
MKDTVVVGYDRTPSSDLALDVAAREAALRGVPLTILSAYPWLAPPDELVPEAREVLGRPAELDARHGAQRVSGRYPGLTVRPLARPGYAWDALAGASDGADLLVVGSRGRGGFTSLLLGSVSARTVGMARCPVMVVRGADPEPRGRVLAAVDVHEPCGTVLEFAFAEAARRGAALEIVHAWEPPWTMEYGLHGEGIGGDIQLVHKKLEDLLIREVGAVAPRHPDVEPFLHVAAGSPGAVVVQAAGLCDVAVVGARRLAGERRRLAVGPLAQTLLRHADCAITLVPYG